MLGKGSVCWAAGITSDSSWRSGGDLEHLGSAAVWGQSWRGWWRCCSPSSNSWPGVFNCCCWRGNCSLGKAQIDINLQLIPSIDTELTSEKAPFFPSFPRWAGTNRWWNKYSSSCGSESRDWAQIFTHKAGDGTVTGRCSQFFGLGDLLWCTWHLWALGLQGPEQLTAILIYISFLQYSFNAKVY